MSSGLRGFRRHRSYIIIIIIIYKWKSGIKYETTIEERSNYLNDRRRYLSNAQKHLFCASKWRKTEGLLLDDMLKSAKLHQQGNGATHIRWHTIDLVNNLSVGSVLSDHFAIHINLNVGKPLTPDGKQICCHLPKDASIIFLWFTKGSCIANYYSLCTASGQRMQISCTVELTPLCFSSGLRRTQSTIRTSTALLGEWNITSATAIQFSSKRTRVCHRRMTMNRGESWSAEETRVFNTTMD